MDAQRGIIVGDSGTVLMTNDGGNTWNKLNRRTTNKLVHVKYVNNDVIYISGKQILKSINGGTNWTLLECPIEVTCVDAVSPDEIYAVGSQFASSNDGGKTWQVLPGLKLQYNYNSQGSRKFFPTRFYIVEENFWVISDFNSLYYSTNKGKTWNPINISTKIDDLTFNYVTSFSYRPDRKGVLVLSAEDRGYLTGYQVVFTSDNLLDWKTEFKDSYLIHDYFRNYKSAILENNHILLLNANGFILRSEDEGKTFTHVNRKFMDTEQDKNKNTYRQSESRSKGRFYSESNGYVLRFNTLFHTENSGESWTANPIETVGNLRDFYFFDRNNGYICGTAGLILKTNDGGKTWVELNTGTTTAEFNKIHFIDEKMGFCGNLKTTDGGNTWVVLKDSKLAVEYFYKIFDANNYLFVGRNKTTNVLIKTSDGGKTWEEMPSGAWSNAAQFTTPLKGYSLAEKELKVSYDAGRTWDKLVDLPLPAIGSSYHYFNSLTIKTDDLMYFTAHSRHYYEPAILFSIRKINNKYEVKEEFKIVGDSSYSDASYIMSFPSDQVTYYVSLSGLVYQTGAPSNIVESKAPGEFQIYPNPSTGIFNIKPDQNFNKPVSFKIIDITGKTVWKSPVYETQNELEINLKHLPKGIYLLIHDGESSTLGQRLIIE